jgi:hypothetical protein
MEQLLRLKINSFFADWLKKLENNDKEGLENSFSEKISFTSSAHGKSFSAKGTTALLLSAFRTNAPNILRSSNHFIHCHVKGTENATLSAYVYGLLNDELIFGATIITHIITGLGGALKFDAIKLAFNWTEGNRSAFQLWKFPIQDRLWQPGDPTDIIVSEIDAPWWQENSINAPATLWDQLNETFSRYSWAIDQSDIKLLTGCFTEDATGNFPPMGFLTGIHEIIAKMKAFRQPWSWMQHFGELLAVEPTDENTATVLVGRIIPQSLNFLEPDKKFGAQYKLRVKKSESVWKISHFDYRSGSYEHLPET